VNRGNYLLSFFHNLLLIVRDITGSSYGTVVTDDFGVATVIIDGDDFSTTELATVVVSFDEPVTTDVPPKMITPAILVKIKYNLKSLEIITFLQLYFVNLILHLTNRRTLYMKNKKQLKGKVRVNTYKETNGRRSAVITYNECGCYGGSGWRVNGDWRRLDCRSEGKHHAMAAPLRPTWYLS
ncbi:hypothetical protein ALC60_13544, partial [Trachymyrmex zeteki]